MQACERPQIPFVHRRYPRLAPAAYETVPNETLKTSRTVE